MRALAGVVVTGLVLLVAATTAQAERHDMMTAWAWAWVDDKPFHDPNTGALLPPNTAYPRGQIKDRGTPDDYEVKMTVTVLGMADQRLDDYVVADGQAVYRQLDRRLDLSSQVKTVRFDLCTVPAADCISFKVDRPLTATPTPTPGGGGDPTPTPQPSPRVDRDGDGVSEPTDCNDTNSSVFPGAREYPGNGLDDDCSGGDQAAKMPGSVKYDWVVTKRTNPRVRFMRVRDALPGAQVTVTCARRRACPFKQRRLTTDRNGEVSLTRLFPRRLPDGARVEVFVAAPNMITKVTRFEIRRGVTPVGRSMCVPVDALKPQKRC